MKIPILQNKEYLNYTNEDVIYRFSNLYKIDVDEINDIFMETKIFLAISFVSKNNEVYINNDLLVIDEMWHNFILFTKTYEEFCNNFFGGLIHHIPISKKEREDFLKLREEKPEEASKSFLEREENLITTVYDFCGEQKVKKWFETYPQKYTKEYLNSIRV